MKRGAWQPLLGENGGGRKLVLTRVSVQVYLVQCGLHMGARHAYHKRANENASLFASMQASIEAIQHSLTDLSVE
jgi:hypothetical protein